MSHWHVYSTPDGWAVKFIGKGVPSSSAAPHVTDATTWDLIGSFNHFPTPAEVQAALVSSGHVWNPSEVAV